MEQSNVYQIISFIRENYKRNELDILEEFIQEKFPEDWQRFESENYDGPEPDYNGWSAGEEAERMHRIQREIK